MRETPVILITGASSAIGGELLSSVAKEEGTILAHYNRGTVPSVGANSKARIVCMRADFSAEEQVHDLINLVVRDFEYPDKIVFLPAPKLKLERFEETDWTRFEQNFAVQVKSTAQLLAAFLPRMVHAQCRGRVVFTLSSVTLGAPPRNMVTYTTMKHALLGLMRSLAVEYARNHICINAVSPSMTETPFLGELPPKIIEIAAAQNPMKRNALSRDVVPVIQFLLSAESEYITGANIPITGGSVL